MNTNRYSAKRHAMLLKVALDSVVKLLPVIAM